MKVIYVAGPYRAGDSWRVELNVREAERIGFELAQLGAVPLVPHSMYRFWDRTLSDRFWLDGTAALLRRSDAIALAPRFRSSAGSLAELDIATALGLPVFYMGEPRALTEVASWLAE